MATKTDSEHEDLAFRLYAERIAKMPAQVNGEEMSRWAFRKAEEFLSVRTKVRSGEESAAMAVGMQLCDVSAPNLKQTHPHNLVSKRFAQANGGEPAVLNRIKQIADWLDKHPRSDDAEVKYEPLDWDVPTTNLARVLLPHYVASN